MKQFQYNIYLALFCYSIVSYVNGFVAVNLYNPIANLSALPDIGFEYLPHILPIYPNVMMLLSGIYFIIRFLRLNNLDNIIRLIWCLTILFAIRIFTFSSTIVPPSTIGCVNRNNSMPVEWNVLKVLIFDNDNTCTDYMFSGHACYFVLFLFFAFELSVYKVEKIMYTIYTCIGLVSIICGRIHYTSDVIVALVLSCWCYASFNTFIKNNMMEQIK